MPNPYRGEIPPDPGAGHPRGAEQIRSHRRRLSRLALDEALRRDPTLLTRYDERSLRLFYRDYERHLEQLALALASGSDEPVRRYGEWLVPVLRRRRMPTADLLTFLGAMGPAVRTVLTPIEDEAAKGILDRWLGLQRRNIRIAGDRTRNPVLRFFWKGVGILD
jgi:hypothetical protein